MFAGIPIGSDGFGEDIITVAVKLAIVVCLYYLFALFPLGKAGGAAGT